MEDHYSWQVRRLKNIFSDATALSPTNGKVSVELSLQDLKLLELLTQTRVDVSRTLQEPLEVKVKQLPPAGEPCAHDSGVFPSPDLGQKEEFDSYQALDVPVPVLYTSKPLIAVQGQPEEAAVYGISDQMERKLAVATSRRKAKDLVKERKQARKHVLAGDGPMTDLDHALCEGKKQRMRLRTSHLAECKYMPASLLDSSYMGCFGELKFHDASIRNKAYIDDGQLHRLETCDICMNVADRLNIRPYGQNRFKFLITNRERKIILALHIYCHQNVQLSFDDFIERSRILTDAGTPTQTTIDKWAWMGKYDDESEIPAETEVGIDAVQTDAGGQ